MRDQPTVQADWKDRFELALSWLAMRFEDHKVCSDSDVLEAAELFTVDAPYADDEAPGARVRDDYISLVDVLEEYLPDYLNEVADGFLDPEPGAR